MSSRLAGEAREALNAGRLDDADALLRRAVHEARALREKAQNAADQSALNAAQLLANRASVALTRLVYLTAADYFRQAADMVPDSQPGERGNYLTREAQALARQGSARTVDTRPSPAQLGAHKCTRRNR